MVEVEKCLVQKKTFRCPWLKGGRKEGGREVVGKLQGGNSVFLGLGFAVLGFIPQRKERLLFPSRETPQMGESSLAHKSPVNDVGLVISRCELSAQSWVMH